MFSYEYWWDTVKNKHGCRRIVRFRGLVLFGLFVIWQAQETQPDEERYHWI